MTRYFDYHPHLHSGNNENVGSSVPLVSRVVMTWKWDIFRGCELGGELVDNGCSCLHSDMYSLPVLMCRNEFTLSSLPNYRTNITVHSAIDVRIAYFLTKHQMSNCERIHYSTPLRVALNRDRSRENFRYKQPSWMIK